MNAKGGTPPGCGAGDGRQAACEKSSQIPPYRLMEMESGLPSQVRRVFAKCRDLRRSPARRRELLRQAEQELNTFKAQRKATDASIFERMDRLGVENVDPGDPNASAAFIERLGSGRAALAKRYRFGTAIEAAQLELERLRMELGHG